MVLLNTIKKDDNPDNITTNVDNKDKDIETSQKDTDNEITEDVKDKENDAGIIANEKDNVENKQLRRTDRTHRMTERARQNQEQVKLKRFWHLYSEGNSNIADVKKELAKSTSDCRFETFIDVLEDSHDKIRDTYEELKEVSVNKVSSKVCQAADIMMTDLDNTIVIVQAHIAKIGDTHTVSIQVKEKMLVNVMAHFGYCATMVQQIEYLIFNPLGIFFT